MTGFWKSLAGMIRIRITSGSLAQTLSDINNLGIAIQDLLYIDELSAEATIYRGDYSAVNYYITRNGQSVKIIKRMGAYWPIRKLSRRPLLVTGMIIYLLLALYLPTRVLFVQVEGNSTVPMKLILEKAEKCGIRFGESRREVRSERVKNALLGQIPELQWVGVNTYGCIAVISVKERSSPQQNKQELGVSNIVAIRDGVITEVSSTQGQLKCRVGQAVKSGQILVSGYIDCGIIIKATRAQGEIFATTLREMTVKTPVGYNMRVSETQRNTTYILQIGKKLINLSQDSGISPATCVKMYETKQLMLPGGFSLPVALVLEHYIVHDQKTVETAEEDAAETMGCFVRNYLHRQMVSGSIIDRSEVVSLDEDNYCLYGRYFCREMISQERKEEIGQYNG